MADEIQQTPSIGRVVHYSYKGNRCAAVITFVHGDACVNLAIYAHNGEPGGASESCSRSVDVPFIDPDGSVNPNKTRMADDTWCWPPRV